MAIAKRSKQGIKHVQLPTYRVGKLTNLGVGLITLLNDFIFVEPQWLRRYCRYHYNSKTYRRLSVCAIYRTQQHNYTGRSGCLTCPLELAMTIHCRHTADFTNPSITSRWLFHRFTLVVHRTTIQPTLQTLQSLITTLQLYKVCQLDFITSAHRADHSSLTQHIVSVELTFATHTLLTPPC